MGSGAFFLLTSDPTALPHVDSAHAVLVVLCASLSVMVVSSRIKWSSAITSSPDAGVMELCTRPLDGSPPPYDGGVRRWYSS